MVTNELQLYPNPTDGTLFLNLENYLGQRGNIVVFNSLGKRVYATETEAFSNSIEELDLGYFPSGVYTIQLNLENGARVSKKIVLAE